MDDQALNDLLGFVIVVVAPLSFCLLIAGLVSRALGHAGPWFIGRTRHDDDQPTHTPSESLPSTNPLTDEHLVIDGPRIERNGARLVISGMGYWHDIDADGKHLTARPSVGQRWVSLTLDIAPGALAASPVARYEHVGSPAGPVEHALILADGRVLSWLDLRDRSTL